MGRKIILDEAAAETVESQLGKAETKLTEKSIPKLKSAESAVNAMTYPKLPEAENARTSASQAQQILEGFLQTFSEYVQSIRDFDRDAASSIKNMEKVDEWRDPSGWSADPAALEQRLIDKLIEGGMSLEEAQAFILENQNALMGLCLSSAYCGDPINMCTGNFIYQKEDIAIPGAFPLAFTRFYNAIGETNTPLGFGWTHNHNVSLVDQGEAACITFEDGHQEVYRQSAGGDYQASVGRYNTLEKQANSYVLKTKELLEYHFDDEGKVESVKDNNGNTTSFSYDDGLLRSVSNACGSLYFSYSEDKYLRELRDHTGRVVSFEYNKGCLISVKHPEGETYQYKYNRGKRLSQMVSPEGVLAVVNEYDTSFRATAQLMADGARLEFEYVDEALSTIATEQNGSRTTYVRDRNNRAIKMEYSDSSEQIKYDENNNRTSYTDRNGNTHRFEYDDKGNLTKAVDPLNNLTCISYNEFSKPCEVINPDKSIVVFEYDSRSNLLQRSDPLGRIWKYSYTASGLPDQIILPDNSTSEVSYDDRGNITSITDAGGTAVSYEYNELNQVIKSTGQEGQTTLYEYNSQGDMVRSVDALGNAISYEYDSNGRVKRIVDYCGHETNFEYNKVNKLARIVDAQGGETTYTYDVMWNITGVTDPEGNTTRYKYDSNNRMIAIIDPEGHTTCFEHDPNGNILSVTTAGGACTTIEYDAMNRAVRQTEPDGAEVLYDYDAAGRPVAIIYPNGCKETWEYDLAGQLVAHTNLRGEKTCYSYTLLGQVSSVVNNSGEKTCYEYYLGGRLKSIQGPGGETESYLWNKSGQVSERIGPDGNSTKMTYDALGRAIAIQDSLGGIRRFKYDPMGRVVSATDANSNTTRYRYSSLGELVEVIDAAGHSTYYGYDSARRLTSMEQLRIVDDALADIHEAERQLTTYEYNRRGEVVGMCNPMGRVVRYSYNADGHLTKKIDTGGLETNYEYTPTGQLEQVHYADGKHVYMKYGELRQLIEMQDWLGTTTIERSHTGQIERIVNYEGTALGYEWDEMGRQKKLIYPDGSSVEYERDSSGYLSTVKAPSGETSFAYDTHGRLVHRTMPGGIETTYTSDHLGRLTHLVHSMGNLELDNLKYSYDKIGNITKIEKHRQGVDIDNGTFLYEYDPLNRLVAATKDGRTKKYIYDSLGNRVGAFDGESTQHYSYNDLNQLTKMQEGEHVSEYHYDQRGNLIAELCDGVAKANYVYDATNMMVEAKDLENGIASYIYDGLRNRVVKQMTTFDPSSLLRNEVQELAETVYYAYDMTRSENNLTHTETNQSSAQNFIWGSGLLAAEGESAQYYLQDHLGSPIRLLGGEECTSLAYDEFGVPLTGVNNPEHNPFGFGGYQIDEVSNFYYVQARYYNPLSSRMVAPDSWRGSSIMPQTLNKYAYCVNNPLTLVDHTGNIPSLSDILGQDADVTNGLIDGITTACNWLSENVPVLEPILETSIFMGNMALSKPRFIAELTGLDRYVDFSMAGLGAPFLDFQRDSEGIYHANQDCWQQHFGYNSIYDAGFNWGTDMASDQLTFSYGGEDYVIWAWRGDYLNLGAGAELGIYRRLMANGSPTNHWEVDTGLSMPMTLRLKDVNGDTIFAYYPTDPQWWVTGFNPKNMNWPADQLVAMFSMDFSGDPGMFEAFMNAPKSDDDRLTFNPFTYRVTFTFMPKGMEGACIV